MNNIVRIAIGASTIGAVTGGGIFLNKFLYTEDIQSKLKANDFEVLSSDNDEGIWEKILKSYTEVSATNSKFKFSEANITNKSELQEQCEKTFKKRVSEDNDSTNYYEKAKRWCTVPTSVSKILEKNRTILDTNSKDDKVNQKEWDEKIKKYTAKNNENKITDLDLGKEAITEVKKENRTAIKAQCEKLNKKESYEEGYEEALKKSETWCTIEKKTE